MDEWKKQGERLLSGKEGAALRSLASTGAARKLGESPDAEALGPYLGAERGKKLSRALGMAAAIRLAGGTLKGAGGHGL